MNLKRTYALLFLCSPARPFMLFPGPRLPPLPFERAAGSIHAYFEISCVVRWGVGRSLRPFSHQPVAGCLSLDSSLLENVHTRHGAVGLSKLHPSIVRLPGASPIYIGAHVKSKEKKDKNYSDSRYFIGRNHGRGHIHHAWLV